MNQKQNLRQAAILLNSLPKKQAAKIFMLLEPSEMEVVFRHMSMVDMVSAKELRQAYDEFVKGTESLQVKKSPKRKNQPTKLPETPPGKDDGLKVGMFNFLVDISPQLQVKLLENEHPKNIALVLSLLPVEVGSGIIHELPSETRVNILRRMCQTDEFDRKRGKQLADILKKRLTKLLNQNLYRKKGVDVATRLLSCVDPQTYDSILSNLDHKDPDLAHQLKQSVFGFTDLQHLSDRDLKVILKSVDTSNWAPALKQGGLELKKKILQNLAAKPAELLNYEMANMGPVSESAAEEARHQIVTICLQLSDRGQIRLTDAARSDSLNPLPGSKRIELAAQPL
ncbi:MAG: hypothetical protein MK108_12505 [Mariniblastus sp.]|nr:hypothetical protein [Mariniblastus sp.]